MAELTSHSTSSLRDWRLAEKECTVFFDRQWAAVLFLSLPVSPLLYFFQKRPASGLLQFFNSSPEHLCPKLSPAAVDHRHTNWPWFTLPCFKCTLLRVLRGAAMSVRSFPTGSLGHYLNEVLPVEVGEHMLTGRYWFVGYSKWWYLCFQSRKEKDISGELFFIIRLNDWQDNDIFGDNPFSFHKVRKYGYTL